jgi:hypothetical protein
MASVTESGAEHVVAIHTIAGTLKAENLLVNDILNLRDAPDQFVHAAVLGAVLRTTAPLRPGAHA